jgi:hypothetical protein
MSASPDPLSFSASEFRAVAQELAEQKQRAQREAVARWRRWLMDNHSMTVSLPDDELSRRHDFIQWWFPLSSASPLNPDAPAIESQWLREAVLTDPFIHQCLIESFHRLLDLLGLALNDGVVAEAHVPFEEWLDNETHTDKRITRALQCLRNAGLLSEAQALYDFLEAQIAARPSRSNKLRWWR